MLSVIELEDEIKKVRCELKKLRRIQQEVLYSFTEIEIGLWLDVDIVYRKVIRVYAPTNSIDVSGLNIKQLIKCDEIINETCCPGNSAFPTYFYLQGNTLNFSNNSYNNNDEIFLILEYTKNT